MPSHGIELPLLMGSYLIAFLSSSIKVSSEDGVIVVTASFMKSMDTRKKQIKHTDRERTLAAMTDDDLEL